MKSRWWSPPCPMVRLLGPRLVSRETDYMMLYSNARHRFSKSWRPLILQNGICNCNQIEWLNDIWHQSRSANYLFCCRFLVPAITDHDKSAILAILLHEFLKDILVPYIREWTDKSIMRWCNTSRFDVRTDFGWAVNVLNREEGGETMQQDFWDSVYQWSWGHQNICTLFPVKGTAKL